MKYLLFLMLFGCSVLEDNMDTETVNNIELTLWLDKPIMDGYYRVKYNENKESDYCSVEYETKPMTGVFFGLQRIRFLCGVYV